MMLKRKIGVCVLVLAAMVMVGASFCPAAEVAKAKLPFSSPNTIVLVRVKNLNAAFKAIGDVVSSFDPNMGAMMVQQMRGSIEKETPGIDWDKPLAILILDPNKFNEHGDAIVGVFTLKDAEAFKKAKGERIEVVGELGVISNEEKPLAEVVAAIKATGLKAIPTDDMKDLAVVNVDAGNLITRYKADINGGLQLLRLQLAGPPPAEGAAPAPPDPAKQMGLKALEYLIKLIDETEKQAGLVELGISLDKDQLTFRLAADATPGSDFANFLARNNRPADVALAKYLPKESYVTSIGSFNPASMGELGTGLVKIAYDILGLGKPEADAVSKVIADMAANASGINAKAAVVAKDGQGGVALYGINDPGKARANTKALVELSKTKSIADFMKKYGITMTLTEKHRVSDGIPVDKIEIEANYETLIAALDLAVGPEKKAAMKEQFGKIMKMAYGNENKCTVEIVYGKKLAVVAYGVGYDKLTDKVIALMKADGADGIGGVPAYMAALNRHPKNSMALGHFSLFGYLDVLGTMIKEMMATEPMLLPLTMFPARAELPPNEDPMTFSAQIAGSRMTIAGHIPMQPIRDIFKVFQQKMMQEMLKRAQPPEGGPDDEE